MAIHASDLPARDGPAALLADDDGARAIAWRDGAAVAVAAFRRHVIATAAALGDGPYALNLCDDRYHFLVGFAAALLRGQCSLLPPSRAPQVLAEIAASHGAPVLIHDDVVDAAIRRIDPASSNHGSEAAAQRAALSALEAGGVGVPAWRADGSASIAAIGFTSGSTGAPREHAKPWHGFVASNAANTALIRACLADGGQGGDTPHIVATVPPQHMYGLETSVLLPLIGGMAVHAGKPLFPAEVAQALAEVPAPRVLVSTPLHLRALCESGLAFPDVALTISATAPLDADLARAVEARLHCQLREVFGSTETCVIAHRRTAREDDWQLQPGVTLTPAPDGTRVAAPWLDVPTQLQDVVELLPGARFRLRGRHVDLIEIAGKRASLADLTRRVLAVPGVRDAVVFQPDGDGVVRRLAALVVAPGCPRDTIVAALREAMDAAFVPRPLLLVDALPRNDVGKLPRDRLLALLRDKKEEKGPTSIDG